MQSHILYGQIYRHLEENIQLFNHFQVKKTFGCIEDDFRLRDARKYTKQARDKGIGIFESNHPLMLMPFELRFLADSYTGFFNEPISCKNNENKKITNQRSSKKPLHRYVIDLSKLEDPVLRKPDQYYKITVEDHLFIDEHFVPLFREKGYEIES